MAKIERRDVLKGLSFFTLACLLPIREREPSEKKFLLFGSSTVVDIKKQLREEDRPNVKGMNGGRIDNMIEWLNEDQVIGVATKDVFFMIGGNEISNTNLSIAQLQIEADKMGILANLASNKFPGKKIHFILPQPTLLENRDPDCRYEERRGIFNQKTKEVLRAEAKNNRNIDQSPIELDNYVFIIDPKNPNKKMVNQNIFRDERHFTDEMLDKIIGLIREKVE